MNSQEYYQRVVDRLKNCYQFSHYVIAAGHELAAEGYDPAFPAATEPIHQLENLTLVQGVCHISWITHLRVHIFYFKIF